MLLVTHSCTLAENSYQFYLSISTWVICEFCDVNKAELELIIPVTVNNIVYGSTQLRSKPK